LIAHTIAQVVREGVSAQPKLIDVGPDFEGGKSYAIPLSEELLGYLRRWILVRGVVEGGEFFDPATDPVIIGPNDDVTIYGQYPEAMGWGVQIAPELSDQVRLAVARMLNRIWLGCAH
jgi:hypothetical protein